MAHNKGFKFSIRYQITLKTKSITSFRSKKVRTLVERKTVSSQDNGLAKTFVMTISALCVLASNHTSLHREEN